MFKRKGFVHNSAEKPFFVWVCRLYRLNFKRNPQSPWVFSNDSRNLKSWLGVPLEIQPKEWICQNPCKKYLFGCISIRTLWENMVEKSRKIVEIFWITYVEKNISLLKSLNLFWLYLWMKFRCWVLDQVKWLIFKRVASFAESVLLAFRGRWKRWGRSPQRQPWVQKYFSYQEYYWNKLP